MVRILLLSCLFGFVCVNADADVVTDKKQRLQWEDSDNDNVFIWKLAKGYCKQLQLDDRQDWRLPTKKELLSLAQNKRLKNKFRYLSDDVYWTSDDDPEDEFNALSVYIENGYLSGTDKCEKNVVLCVRKHKK